jgi:DNA-binding transcriptional LysR family regulator
MERARRLITLWNWLPGFRAVAETQHLPEASKQLRVSPSALSRTIRLLEREIGEPLFNRVGRNLELNTRGHILLSGVRDSMRLLDDTLNRMAGEQFAGGLAISCVPGYAERYLLSPLERIKREYPRLVPTLVATEPEPTAALLLRGHLDIAFTLDPRANDELEIIKLTELSCGLYAGRGHPLFSAGATLADALAHELVAEHLDSWTGETAPKLGARAGLPEAQLLCAAGLFLALLPDPIARMRSDLLRIADAPMRPLTFYAQKRRSHGGRGRVEVLVDAVLEEIRARP